jgi:Ku protein
MPQAVWIGHLSFGLVDIPVKLYGATSPRDVRFHHYEAGTGRRIRYQRVASGPPAGDAAPPDETERVPAGEEAEPAVSGTDPTALERPAAASPQARPPAASEGAAAPPSGVTPLEPPPPPAAEEDVPWERVVKGFEIEPGRVVTVTPEDLRSVAPERSRVLEVEQFDDLHRIDPIHFEKSYYLIPQSRAAERPYWLLHRAMETAGKVAIGRFVMRTKEYLAAVRPGQRVLVLHSLFYADEIRDAARVWSAPAEEPPAREVEVARNLIEALTSEWDPARSRDEYRERVLDLLRSKAGEAWQAPPEGYDEAPVPPAIDLLEALQASVDAARRAKRRRDVG